MQAIAGNDVTLSFNVAVDATLSGTATAQMRVSGPSGVLADWQPIVEIGNPELFTVIVPAALNQLADSIVPREARLVEIDVDCGPAIGIKRFYLDYVIVRDGDELTPMVNSFQSYLQALTVAATRRDLPNWAQAEADDRKLALQSAFADLCRLSYDLATYDRDDISYRYQAGWGFVTTWFINRLWLYSATDFAALPPDFRAKLCQAQVIEADARLASTPGITDYRNDGVVSKKVGEDQTVFRTGVPLKMALAPQTLLALRPYARMILRPTRC